MNYSHTLIVATLVSLIAVKPMKASQKDFAFLQDPGGAITKISYSTTGGRGGNTVSLDITSMTLLYVQTHNGVEKTIKEKTPRSLWMSLTRSINTKDLDKIKSNPGHALYDGIDVTISIAKGKEIHSIVNGNEDAGNYRRIKAFTDILDSQLSRLEKKVKW